MLTKIKFITSHRGPVVVLLVTLRSKINVQNKGTKIWPTIAAIPDGKHPDLAKKIEDKFENDPAWVDNHIHHELIDQVLDSDLELYLYSRQKCLSSFYALSD